MQHLVSIITPVYNSSKYLSHAVESVLNQTYPFFEMIIVDDGSTDESSEMAAQYAIKDSRIKFFKNEKNRGAWYARNVALEASSGKYIAFLDSDDWWLPEKLEKQIRFMETENCVFCFSSYYLVKEEGCSSKRIVSAPKSISYDDLLRRSAIGCLTVVVDVEQTGLFRMPNISSCEDTATWLSILKKGHIAQSLQEPLAYYQTKPGVLWGTPLSKIFTRWHVYRGLEGLSFLRSLRCHVESALYALSKRILRY